MDAPSAPLNPRVAPRRVREAICVAALSLLAMAHIGTNDAITDGMAGPYPVRVVVRPAGVVPGRAQVAVRVLAGDPRSVVVRAVPTRLGPQNAPAGDSAKLVAGEKGLYATDVWLMTSGSYSVSVDVDGSQGHGTIVVPVTSIATKRLGMPRGIGIALSVLGVLLIAGVLTIVRAATREALVPEGAVPGPDDRSRARVGVAIATAVLLIACLGGFQWWQAEDARYRLSLFTPIAATAHVTSADARRLRIDITDSLWRADPPAIVPDHGKIAHLFLVREHSMETLAHLHPVRSTPASFETPLPELAAGRYLVFLDVVSESGRSHTITTGFDQPSSGVRGGALDPDDSFMVAGAIAPSPSAVGALTSPLNSGMTMTWDRAGELTAGPELTIRILVRDASGKPVTLEPYLGMTGHAVVVRDDAGVFVHLHPMGTVSVAAESLATSRWVSGGGTSASSIAPAHIPDTATDGLVRFPFAFPSPGRYRIWVQVRVRGVIETGVFDTVVRPART